MHKSCGPLCGPVPTIPPLHPRKNPHATDIFHPQAHPGWCCFSRPGPQCRAYWAMGIGISFCHFHFCLSIVGSRPYSIRRRAPSSTPTFTPTSSGSISYHFVFLFPEYAPRNHAIHVFLSISSHPSERYRNNLLLCKGRLYWDKIIHQSIRTLASISQLGHQASVMLAEAGRFGGA